MNKEAAQSPQDDRLYIQYVDIDKVNHWDRNAKIHNLPGIIQSIMTHGFRNAPIFDATLNNGKGGLLGGNGSITALRKMRENNYAVPRYIATDDEGKWYAPIQFGGDSASLDAAEALAVDLNNLTLAGFTPEQQAKVWDREKYLSLMERAAKGKTPLASMSKEKIMELVNKAKEQAAEGDEEKEKKQKAKGKKLSFAVDDPELVNAAIRQTGIADRSEALLSICQFFVSHAPEPKQSHCSADTSINADTVPKVFKLVQKHFGWGANTLNLDLGGGKYDTAQEWLRGKQLKVTNLVYDPYNRTADHNEMVLERAHRHGGADSATISNVLNVIPELKRRQELLTLAHEMLRPGGRLFVTIYEGDGSGTAAETPKGWQANRPLADYLYEIKAIFLDAEVAHNVIIASRISHGEEEPGNLAERSGK